MSKFTFRLKHPIQTILLIPKRIVTSYTRSKKVSDKKAISCSYFFLFRKKINWNNPQTFNEKLNWLKLNYRKKIFTSLADKYEVKEIIKDKIGEEHIAKTLGVFSDTKSLDIYAFEPPFVIKVTHTSGGVFVIKDKKDINEKEIKEKINKLLKKNYFYHAREWPYKDIKPRIIVEEYLTDSINEVLPVYKFFCFNGEPYLLQAIENDKHENESIDYFDMDWRKLDLRQNFKNSKIALKKPENFEEMKEIAKKLSQGFPFIRVDLYNASGKIYFSEFTFFSDAGYTNFHPKKWDKILGDKIIIPEIVREDL